MEKARRTLRLGKRGLDMSSIRVLVVEDFVAFRRVISSILGKRRDLQIIGEVSDGFEAVRGKRKNCSLI